MNIFLTGSSGFIGRHLVRSLNKEYQLVCPDREFFSKASVDELRAFILERRIDVVIHLATHFVREHRSEDLPRLIESNLHLGLRILEALKETPGVWFLNTGSAWEHAHGKEEAPMNLYAATKEAFAGMLKVYEEKGVPSLTLTLFETFGEKDTRDKVLNLLDRASRSGEILPLSPGGQILDLCHIDDVVRGYLGALELIATSPATVRNRTFALSGERLTLQKLVATFEEVTGRKVGAEWGKLPYRPREVMVPWEDFEALPGWSPQIPLEDGLRRSFKGRGP